MGMCVFWGLHILPQEAAIYVGGGILRCVRAHIQTAPTGMNYLEKSLFYLSTVRRARAHKVLLSVSQETGLIHHPAWRTVPTSQPPTPAHLPARSLRVHCRCPCITPHRKQENTSKLETM